MNELQKNEAVPLAQPLNVGSMMQAMIDKGVTADNVLALQELVKLHKVLEDRDAEKQFTAAFVELQSAMPNVQKMRPVESKGVLMYHFAPFEDIMASVGPFLKKHGFAVTFSQRYADNHIVALCTLMHKGGYSRTNEFAVRAGKGPPNASDAQGDGSNSTVAKRNALCNALNIVLEGMDDDARAVGGPITLDEARDFEMRMCNLFVNTPKDPAAYERNRDRFFTTAGATSYATIPVSKWETLNQMLTKKESAAIPH